MRFALALLGFLVAEVAAARTSASALLATLHRAQDALVREGASAKPVHDRLLRLLDVEIARADSDATTGDVVRYALSGGDPRVVHRALANVAGTARDAVLVRAVLAHVSGRTDEAVRLFALIDPSELRGRLAGLVAMAKAGANARGGNAEAARAALQRVRLDAPGTLLEEAATRRLALLHLEAGRAEQFFHLVRHYWHRFPRSAFRAQMRRALRAAAARFDETELLRHLPRTAAWPPAEASSFRAEVARAALLNGWDRLAEVAVRGGAPRSGGTPRERFLRSLTRLTDNEAGSAGGRLLALTPEALPPGDRILLLASQRVARAITAPIPPFDGDPGPRPLAVQHRALLRAVDKLLTQP